MKKNILKLLISLFLLLNFTQNINALNRSNKEYFIYDNTLCELIQSGKDKKVYSLPSKQYGRCALVKYNKKSKIAIDLYTREVNFLNNLKHENIIKILYEDPENLIFFLEKGETDLCEYIKENKLKTINEKLDILEQIAKGLVYLHKNQIIHGDIKTENVVKVNNKWKLIDFTYSLETDKNGEIVIDFCRGTDTYVAPEIMCNYFIPTKENYLLSTKSDIWSFGMLADVVMVQKSPDKSFEKDHKCKYTFEEYKDAILNGWIPKLPSENSIDCLLNNMIKSCLSINPEDRPTAQKVLEWVREAQKIIYPKDTFEEYCY